MKRPRRRGRAMPSIVRLCRMCHGDLGGQCWNCRPSRRAPYHPGPGYTLEGRRASEYPVGTILVDVYFADRWEVMPCPKRRGVITRQRRLSDGFEVDDYQDQARYLTPEEIADPETWRLPTSDKPRRTAPINDKQGVLL